MKKIIAFISKYISFSKYFIHPEVLNHTTPDLVEVNKDLQKKVEVKIEKERDKKMEAIKPHLKVLNEYLVTYFQTPHKSQEAMRIAYHVINNDWIKYIKGVNSSVNYFTHLNKDSFKNEVQRVVKQLKLNKEKENGIKN